MSDDLVKRRHPSDLVSRLLDRARCHEKLLRAGDNAEPWPELFREAAARIEELEKERDDFRDLADKLSVEAQGHHENANSQAFYRREAEARADALAALLREAEEALRKIAASDTDRRTGHRYTTGEGHAECVWAAAAALARLEAREVSHDHP